MNEKGIELIGSFNVVQNLTKQNVRSIIITSDHKKYEVEENDDQVKLSIYQDT